MSLDNETGVFSHAMSMLGKEIFTDDEAYLDFCEILMQYVEDPEKWDTIARVVLTGALPVLIAEVFPAAEKSDPGLQAKLARSVRSALERWIQNVKFKTMFRGQNSIKC